MKKLPVAFILVLLLLGCESKKEADLILYNGKIITVDDQFSIQQAIVVRSGRVVAVGSNDIVKDYNAKETIDLGGKTLMPGFNDTHIHLQGNLKRYIELADIKSITELQDRIRTKATELGEGEWITGYGWAEDNLAEQRNPTIKDLDIAAPKNPVFIVRAGGHSSVSNSLAFAKAGITKSTRDPESGMIEHNKDGSVNGLLRERNDLVDKFIPEATFEEIRPSFVAKLRDLFRLGITSMVPAGQTIEQYHEWEQVYASDSLTLPRATVQIYWPGTEALKEFGKITGDGDDHLKVGAIKVLVDGGFTGPSAYTTLPYKGKGSFRGTLNYKEDEIKTMVNEGHALGWQLGFHAIGDAAIILTVNDFVEALEKLPRNNHRHYLNHFTVPPPATTMDAMAKHSILISQQPNFTYSVERRYLDNLDGDRLEHNNPLRTPMNKGIFMALSSDILPIGPMVGLSAAVTRKGKSGRVYAPEEKLTIEEAITGYTKNAAYITFDENKKGVLAPGMLADMIVLSKDPLTINPDSLMTVEVEKTFLGGRLVYSKK